MYLSKKTINKNNGTAIFVKKGVENNIQIEQLGLIEI